MACESQRRVGASSHVDGVLAEMQDRWLGTARHVQVANV